MNIIAAVDNNWAIGNKNSLLVKIPKDQRLFMEMTAGKVVVMGRNTLESLPQGQPLEKRENIILSSDLKYTVKGAQTVHSLPELFEKLGQYKSSDVFVAGGACVYRQLLPYCDTAYITKINYEYEADAYFPALDKLPEWELAQESDEQTYFDLEYYFLSYRKVRSGR